MMLSMIQSFIEKNRDLFYLEKTLCVENELKQYLSESKPFANIEIDIQLIR